MENRIAMRKTLLSTAIILFAAFALAAQPRQYTFKNFTARNGQVLPYAVLYPENFDPCRQYPLLLFLHGSGERGTDGSAQLKHGGEFFASAEQLHDVIFLAPQCPKEDAWACYGKPAKPELKATFEFPYVAPVSSSLTAVKELLDAFESLGFVDTDRVYACGLSLGAIGILDFAMRWPDYFAAIEPICGAVSPRRCSEFGGRTQFRFFHGLEDEAVLPRHSIEADKALKSAGVHSEIVLYPEVQHNSWNNAFAEADFLDWMLSR